MKLLPLLILLFNVTNAQMSPKAHGTLISAAICKDGIIMCADSRGAWTATNDTTGEEIVYASIDENKKIFPIGRYNMGISGYSTINNIFWEVILRDYNKSNTLLDTKVSEEFKNFYLYVKNRFGVADSVFYKNSFIISGYEQGIPIILRSDIRGSVVFNSVGDIVFSNLLGYGFPIVYKQTGHVYDSTFAGGVDLMKFVYDWASRSYNNMVGGPTYYLKINSDNQTALLSTFKTIYFNTYQDYEKAVLKNKLPVKYYYEWSRKTLEKELKKDVKSPSVNY